MLATVGDGPHAIPGDDHESTLTEMLDELLAWSDALRPVRTGGVVTTTV